MNDSNPAFHVGVDIETITRFEKADVAKDTAFLNKVFTTDELDYCLSMKVPAQHLVARFAGKEAIIKALAGFERAGLGYKDIQITNDNRGVPVATIRKAGFDDLQIKLSLSHSEDEAVAFAIVIEIKQLA